jgi:hypothetical protein
VPAAIPAPFLDAGLDIPSTLDGAPPLRRRRHRTNRCQQHHRHNATTRPIVNDNRTTGPSGTSSPLNTVLMAFCEDVVGQDVGGVDEDDPDDDEEEDDDPDDDSIDV